MGVAACVPRTAIVHAGRDRSSVASVESVDDSALGHQAAAREIDRTRVNQPAPNNLPPVRVALAATQHDPEGRLNQQIARALPVLTAIFDAVAIQSTHASHAGAIGLLRAAGALVRQESSAEFNGLACLGGTRRAAVELGLRTTAQRLLFCDFDRALHWAEYYPDELAQVAARIGSYDFTVLGRTPRAFESHPGIQRDTEAIINRVFAQGSGHAWDVTAAARGLSRRAATAILAGCPDQSIGTDMSWPLFIQRQAGYSIGYLATEGLEFETADRYADQIAAAGSRECWIANLDADPRQWAIRLELARIEVESAIPYLGQS